jgi:hypothetical protein
MILIGISGKKGSGKDLLATILARKYAFRNAPFAAQLKAGVRRDFGLSLDHTDGSKKEENTRFIRSIKPPDAGPGDTCVVKLWTPRDIMIAYGQFFRQFNPLWWVEENFKAILNANFVDDACGREGRYTISDVRFKNEKDFIRREGGFLVRLNRRQDLNVYQTPSSDISETELDGQKDWDFELPEDRNITPEDLEEAADEIMGRIRSLQLAQEA